MKSIKATEDSVTSARADADRLNGSDPARLGAPEIQAVNVCLSTICTLIQENMLWFHREDAPIAEARKTAIALLDSITMLQGLIERLNKVRTPTD